MVFEYPESLRELYSAECVAYRDEKLNQRMFHYLRNRVLQGNVPRHDCEDFFIALDAGIKKHFYISDDGLDVLKEYGNFLIPDSALNGNLANYFDVITSAGTFNGNGFMFVEDWPNSGSNRFSSGKTATMMQLLGVKIPYNELRGSDSVRRLSGRGNAKLITSDMGYVFTKDGFLQLAPVIGEELITQWDLARHVSRMLNPEINYQEKNRTPEQTAYLERIGELCQLDSALFSDNSQSYPIGIIFFVNKTGGDRVKVETVLPSKKESKEKVRAIFENNPCYHCNNTKFWRINLDEHRRRLDALVDGLDEDKLPGIYHVDIPCSADYGEVAREVLDVMS